MGVSFLFLFPETTMGTEPEPAPESAGLGPALSGAVSYSKAKNIENRKI